MIEPQVKVVIAERRLVGVLGIERIYQECPEPLGPPWRLSISPPSELVVFGLYLGMVDLFNPRKEFRPRKEGVVEAIVPTGVAANAFAGAGTGLPLHGPRLERGNVIAIDLYNPWLSSQEVWVSLWGTLP